MQVWVATMARRGRHAADQRQWMTEHAPSWLPYGDAIVRSDCWTSPDDKVQLHTWDNGQDHVDCSIGVGADGTALTTSGYVLSGEQLLTSDDLVRRSPGGAAVLELGGVFTICRCDSDEQIKAWASRGRLDAVFYATGPDLLAVSNRPLAAHFVARRATVPAYAYEFGMQLISNGLPAGTGTPFEGVEQVPELTELRVTPAGFELVEVADERFPAPSQDAIAEVTDALTSSIAFIGALDSDLSVSLSGGKDSRLVCALMAHSGAQFKASTGGLPSHPDVVIAKQVAKRLGIDHSVASPARDGGGIEVDIGVRLHRVVRGAEGMLCAWDSPTAVLPTHARRGVGLGGAGGEVLRGGLAKHPTLTTEQLRKKVRYQMLRNEHLLTSDTVAARERDMEAWLLTAAGGSGPEALAWYHRDIRLGRWNMASRMGQGGKLQVPPFLDSQAIRWAMRLPIEDRLSERAFFAILERVDPALARMPLATSDWRFLADGAPPPHITGRTFIGRGLSRWRVRQMRAREVEARPFQWRSSLSGELGDELVRQIDDSPARDRLDGIVDWDAYEGFVADVRAGKHDGDPDASLFIWALATIAVLWADEWRGPPPEPRTITIRRPPD